MKLIYHENKALPRLAWCAVAIRKNFEIHVYHGQGIETNENFFVEGAWDGEFTSGGFERSSFFMGTGGKSQNIPSGGYCLLRLITPLKDCIALGEAK
jgi:hypothetical protein